MIRVQVSWRTSAHCAPLARAIGPGMEAEFSLDALGGKLHVVIFEGTSCLRARTSRENKLRLRTRCSRAARFAEVNPIQYLADLLPRLARGTFTAREFSVMLPDARRVEGRACDWRRRRHVSGSHRVWGMLAAGSLVVSIPVVFFFVHWHMVAGLTAGEDSQGSRPPARDVRSRRHPLGLPAFEMKSSTTRWLALVACDRHVYLVCYP
jgi:hypothetical protein